MRDCITMCFDICAINIRVSIRVRGLHLVSISFLLFLFPFSPKTVGIGWFEFGGSVAKIIVDLFTFFVLVTYVG